jgi:hypothetical protein
VKEAFVSQTSVIELADASPAPGPRPGPAQWKDIDVLKTLDQDQV